ncbi:MAG: type VII secretion target [Mycobacterium sp.]|nr:type VII secretion target [Mycobacterium sp.]
MTSENVEVSTAQLRSDLTALGDSLRAAADAYDRQDHEAGGAIDTAVRYA